MNSGFIIRHLSGNRAVFNELLRNLPREEHTWRPGEGKWCLLEILCHLLDEERDDFRARTKQVLENPALLLPPIDPEGWVSSRRYMERDYDSVLEQFLSERETSVRWLGSLSSPKWDNACQHPRFGAMPARMFLSNWLAHDYLHLRQIIRLKYGYLMQRTGVKLDYAGKW